MRQPNCSSEKVYERIASIIPPLKARTPTDPYQVPQYPETPTLAWLLALLLLLAASHRAAFLVPSVSSMYHTMADPALTWLLALLLLLASSQRGALLVPPASSV